MTYALFLSFFNLNVKFLVMLIVLKFIKLYLLTMALDLRAGINLVVLHLKILHNSHVIILLNILFLGKRPLPIECQCLLNFEQIFYEINTGGVFFLEDSRCILVEFKRSSQYQDSASTLINQNNLFCIFVFSDLQHELFTI